MHSLTPTRLLLLSGTALLLVLSRAVDFPAFSQGKHPLFSLMRCSRDQQILDAFQKMAGSRGQSSLDWIVQRPVRVIFKDLKTLNKRVKNYDALSWLSLDGQQVIFINEKHRNAPPEALAALIAHEALHSDPSNSVNEEVAGWRKEAEVWGELKLRQPELAQIPAAKYPLVDRLNRIEAELLQGNLENFVRSNPGYQGLPEHSPGY